MRGCAAAAFLAVTAVMASQASAATFELDPHHSFVHFEVRHFGTSTTRGRFGPVHGQAEFDADRQRGAVRLRIDMNSIDTGLAVFNSRLKQPDLLATTEHPEAYFVAERFVFEGARLAEVRGEFTLRGISQPLALKAQSFACRTDEPAGQRVCGGDFEASVKRSDFGMTFGLPLVADSIRLLIQVEGRCIAGC
jgi:polyisoprenoid-binding protein YceI